MSRIREIRKAKGISADGLGKLIGKSGPAISRWETGERELKVTELLQIAEALDVSPSELLDSYAGNKMEKVMVIGEARDGLWLTDPTWPEDRRETLDISPVDAWKGLPRYGLKFGDDEFVVCVRIRDIPNRPIVVGKRYHVERTNDEGKKEWTIRRLSKDPDGGLWLVTGSDNPAHVKSIPFQFDNEGPARIEGRVIGTWCQE